MFNRGVSPIERGGEVTEIERESAQRPTMHERFRARLGRNPLVSLGVAGALLAGCTNGDELTGDQRAEVALIEKERQNIDAFSIHEDAIMLGDGVVIYETPSLNEGDSNIYRTVGERFRAPEGDNQPLLRRSISFEQDGVTWLGFSRESYEEGETEIGDSVTINQETFPPLMGENSVSPTVISTAQELGKGLVYVPLSELESGTNDQNERLITKVNLFDDSGIELVVGADGKFYSQGRDGELSYIGQVAMVDSDTVKQLN